MLVSVCACVRACVRAYMSLSYSVNVQDLRLPYVVSIDSIKLKCFRLKLFRFLFIKKIYLD